MRAATRAPAPMMVLALLAAAAATHSLTTAQQLPPGAVENGGGGGEVAYAAPPAPEAGADSVGVAGGGPLACTSPCFVADTASGPFRTCKAECSADVCGRGYGVFQSRDVCCAPGVAFPEGCSARPRECWVVESYTLRTCVRDDRKCLQGYGVFASEAVCCSPGTAFPNGCGNVTKAATPCWVVDTYWPTRQCRASRTLCGSDAGVQTFADRAACCAPGGAFTEGCSPFTPPLPCWIVDSYFPARTCRQSADPAVCNRGWSVFQSQEICCAVGAGFSEGCSVAPAPPAAAGAAAVVPEAVPTAAPAAATPAATIIGPASATQGLVTASTTP